MRMDDLAREVRDLIDARRFAEALPLARRWVEQSPDDWVAHADLNIVAKLERSFEESRRAGLRALALGGERVGTGVHWNLGVAGTALGDWALARASWTACGLSVPAGEGPVDLPLGPTPIRIGRTAREVVWTDRICPARAIVRNVPLPESGRRYGDLILHDGEPRGTRRLGDRDVAVFDELGLLERSPFRTRVLVVEADAPADVASLLSSLEGRVQHAEDWSGSVGFHCEACSLGTPHDHDERAWQRERHIGFASREDVDDAPLQEWESAGPGRRVLGIDVVDDAFEQAHA